MKKGVSLSRLSNAGQPQEVAPLLAAGVRPPLAKRAVFALAKSALTRSCLYHKKRGGGTPAYGTERSERSDPERNEVERSGEAVVQEPSLPRRSAALCAVPVRAVRV